MNEHTNGSIRGRVNGMSLRICHMYPDLLNLYSDTGNLIAMKYRLQQRGINVEIEECFAGMPLRAADYDLIFIGGGQDFEEEVLLRDLIGRKSVELRHAIQAGMPVLAICGGYQLLGQYYKTAAGRQLDFTGALNLYTVGGEKRLIGNMQFETRTGLSVVGFENHSGRTYLGEDLSPLGRMVHGYGNNGEDQSEGVRYLNVYGSYAHGPLLPKNPALCDEILQMALEYKYGYAVELTPLNDSEEQRAHHYMIKRLKA